MARPNPTWTALATAVLASSTFGAIGSSLIAGRTAARQVTSSEQAAYYAELSKRIDVYAARLDALEAANRELATERARLLAERVVDRREIADLRGKVARLERELSALRRRAE